MPQLIQVGPSDYIEQAETAFFEAVENSSLGLRELGVLVSDMNTLACKRGEHRGIRLQIQAEQTSSECCIWSRALMEIGRQPSEYEYQSASGQTGAHPQTMRRVQA